MIVLASSEIRDTLDHFYFFSSMTERCGLLSLLHGYKASPNHAPRKLKVTEYRAGKS